MYLRYGVQHVQYAVIWWTACLCISSRTRVSRQTTPRHIVFSSSPYPQQEVNSKSTLILENPSPLIFIPFPHLNQMLAMPARPCPDPPCRGPSSPCRHALSGLVMYTQADSLSLSLSLCTLYSATHIEAQHSKLPAFACIPSARSAPFGHVVRSTIGFHR